MVACLRIPDDLDISTQGVRAWCMGWPALVEVDNIQETCGLTMVARCCRLVKPLCLQLPLPDVGGHRPALPAPTGSCEVSGRLYIQDSISDPYLTLDFVSGQEEKTC